MACANVPHVSLLVWLLLETGLRLETCWWMAGKLDEISCGVGLVWAFVGKRLDLVGNYLAAG
eukprot:5850087-Lingulodinium_polyedra.AAC.1